MNTENTADILETVVNESVETFDPLAAAEAAAQSVETDVGIREIGAEPLPATVETEIQADGVSGEFPSTSVTVEAVRSPLREKLSFLVQYAAVSSAIFAVLLGVMNFSAYSTVAMSWLSPEAAKASAEAVRDILGKSEITAHAAEAESGSVSEAERAAEAESLKEKLKESNVAVKENVLSPSKLVPAKPNISVDLDIAPYENRIVVPKIGKNVPLVDVEPGHGFDFDHMENIFMKELEKGVVRYPGTSRPGEKGNAFVFGHSSNYPWMPGQYNDVFALMDHLDFGDEITVYYGQKKFVYVVREKKIVKPGDVKILNRDQDKKELSLMTCWPIGTTLRRMIVFAELKETP